MREGKLVDLVFEVFKKFKGRVYRCSDVSECIDELVRELSEELKRATNGYCFIEAYDDCGVDIACGLLETFYVTIDYDIEEIVRVKGFKVELDNSDISKHGAKELTVALGKLVNKEFKSDGWLGRLVSDFEEELRKISSECRVVLYSASFSVDRRRVDRIHYAEIVVRCNGQEPIFARVYVDLEYSLRAKWFKVE